MKKKDLLKKEIEHIDIKKINSVDIINAMRNMSFSARDLANAADLYDRMLKEKNCAVILTLAGSTSAAGCMQVYVNLVKNNMIDAIVATGASIVDMDFFEALGFKHYQGTPFVDDKLLRKLYVDRIYDTYIDEEQLQSCDRAIKEIANTLEPRAYSSREFIREMGKYLQKHSRRNFL
jgi:deoxyhypusine synthase